MRSFWACARSCALAYSRIVSGGAGSALDMGWLKNWPVVPHSGTWASLRTRPRGSAGLGKCVAALGRPGVKKSSCSVILIGVLGSWICVGGARLRRLWGCSSSAFLVAGRALPALVEEGSRAVSFSFGGAGCGGLGALELDLDLDSWKSTVYGRKLTTLDEVKAQSCK